MNRRNFFGVTAGLIPLNVLGKSVVEGVCKSGKPEDHCRYFATNEENSPACLKLTHFKQEIDEQVALFLREISYDPRGCPIGDNCLGCAPPLHMLLE